MRPLSLAALLAPCLLGACITTVELRRAGIGSVALAQAPATRSWLVLDRGEIVGSVVRFDEGGGPERFVYSVRNEHNQDLGIVDSQGRAWRERPHREPEWIGTGAVLDGVRGILGTGAGTRLEEVGVERMRAAAEAGAVR